MNNQEEWDSKICEDCGHMPVRGGLCKPDKTVLLPGGAKVPAVPHKSETNCMDCGVLPECQHHAGCSNARCPGCGRKSKEGCYCWSSNPSMLQRSME